MRTSKDVKQRLKMLKQDKTALKYMSEDIKDNKNLFIKIVKKDPMSLQHD